ncbi:hypothetical protein [Shewanella sp. 10N.286.52.B9]|uniref:hypothetical protein n=1 Tax=Shewanella sp. 10N.286.52.B9 TaxID=1880837 RepID=UPI000C81B270|nr:hypothetical protein [Shewanella sp. 10N.286.52.B9]PMG41742.1 hypothetical protein BCU91_09845 [Shewanella sp. 10N.286.52.B9]
MAVPFILLGSAAITAMLVADEHKKRQLLHRQRYLGRAPAVPDDNNFSPLLPSILHHNKVKVSPEPGAIVCCFVFGVIEHTGVWLGDNSLVELHGSGLIRPISSARFLKSRSGSRIFQACNHLHQPLVAPEALERAQQSLFQYREYELFNNNCHRFVWSCISGQEVAISNFDKLNQRLALHFKQAIYWDELASPDRPY